MAVRLQTILLSPNSSTQFQYTTPVRPTASSKLLLNSIRGRLAIDTPIKALPFSPSQFFNSPCNTNGQNMATSTPVKQRGKVRPPREGRGRRGSLEEEVDKGVFCRCVNQDGCAVLLTNGCCLSIRFRWRTTEPILLHRHPTKWAASCRR